MNYMNRRTWIVATLSGIAAFLTAATALPRLVLADVHRLDAQTLKYTLGVGRPEDKAFIDRVVAKMEAGELPQSIVEKCFVWAKKKPKNKFEYFKRALIALAKSKNITVS
jgi:hypothetical protein